MDFNRDISYMFLNVEGEPFQFYLHDFEEKGRIVKLIEDAGGSVEEEPHGDFTIQLAAPASIQLEADINEVFSFQYVIECCARNQTVDIRKYRLNKTSVYSPRFNPTDVLQKKISWSEAYKYRLPEKIPGTENRWRINSPEKLKERKNTTICSYYREKKTNASKQQRSVTSTVRATSDDDDEGSYVGSTKGRKYLQSEQENMVAYIIKCKAYEHLHERDFWMRLEKKQICKNRSWESLKKQFFNKILPNIESFCTSEKRIARFKQLITVHRKKKQEKDVRQAEPEVLQTEEEDEDVRKAEPEVLQTEEEDDTYRSVTGSSGGASFIRNTKFYSEEEDKALLNFITTGKRHLEAGGVRIWKFMERKEVVPGRSWQSLKERYRKHLVKNLEKYLPKDQVDKIKYAHLKGHKNKKVKKKVPCSSGLEKTDNNAVKHNEPARNRLPKKRKLFSQRESTDELSSNSEKETSKELRGELNRQRTTKPLVEKKYGTTVTNVSDEGSLQNNPRESKRSQISKKINVKHKTTTNENVVEDGIESCGGSANNENIRNEESIALNSIEVHRHDRARINRDNVIANTKESCKDVNQNVRRNEENVIGNTIQSNADNAVNDEISKTIQYLKTLLNHRISSTKNTVTGENSHISQSELLRNSEEYNIAQEAKGNSTKADVSEFESDVSMHLATSQIVCEERQYKGNKKPQEISAIHGSDLESTETERHTPEFDSEQSSESNESFSASKAVTGENSHISQNELLQNSEENNIAQEAKGNSTKADVSEFESDASMHLATSQTVCEERRYKGNKKPDTPKLDIYNRKKIMRREISVIQGSDLESTETERHTPESDSEQSSESNESLSASKAVTGETSHISQNELLQKSKEYNIPQEAKGIRSNSHFVSTQHTNKTDIQDVSKHCGEMRLNEGEQNKKIVERIIVSKASDNSIVCRTQKTNPQNALQERNIAVIDDSLVEALYKKVFEKMPKLKSSNLQLELLQPPKNEFSGEILQDDAVSSTKEIQSKLKDKISSFRSGNSSQISINQSELSTCKLISNLNVIGEFPEKILTGNLSKPTEPNTLQMEGINMMVNPITDSYENIKTVYHINSMEKDPVNSIGSDHKRKTKSTLQTYQQDVHTSRETSHRYVSKQSGGQSRKKSYETYPSVLTNFRNKKKRRKVHETTSCESEERCSICDCDEYIEPQML